MYRDAVRTCGGHVTMGEAMTHDASDPGRPFNEADLRRWCHPRPVEVDDAEPFPQSLRLVVSSHCGQTCQYPDEGVLWCHAEGVGRDALKPARVEQVLAVARSLRDRHGYRRAKVGGLEPSPGGLLRLVAGLRGLGFDDVSFTTHGRGMNGLMGPLRDAGLTRLTVSVQHFDREGYRRLTGRDGLAAALALVREANAVGLGPPKVNRVLLRGHTADLPAFLAWARGQGATVRLYDLMWQPGHDAHYRKYHVGWEEFLPLWGTDTDRLSVRRYATSRRTRVQFHLSAGGAVEVNLRQSKRSAGAAVCRSCPRADSCAEGYLGCGVRVTPDLRLSPCVLRDDLSVPIRPGEEGGWDGVLRGDPPARRSLAVLGPAPSPSGPTAR